MALDSANALATLADAKVHLGVPSATHPHDAMIENFLNAAAMTANRLTNRKLLQRSIVEYRDGDGGTLLYTRDYPISAVALDAPVLYVSSDDPRSYAGDNLIAAADQIIDYEEGLIRLASGSFAKGRQTIKLTYKGGYTIGASATLPWDLRNAYLDLVRFMYEQWKGNRIAIESQTISGVTTAFVKGIPVEVLEVFAGHARKGHFHREA